MNSKKSRAFNELFTQFKKPLFISLKTVALTIGLLLLGSCGESTKPLDNPPDDPPPIIIRTGSFVLEADSKLNEPPPGALAKPYSYILNGFTIKSIWVCHFNYIKPVTDPCKAAPAGADVKIWFEDSSPDPDVKVVQNGSDFLLTIMDKKLNCKNSSSPTRPKECREDNVEVKNFTVNGEPFQVNDGDIYTIGFYNK